MTERPDQTPLLLPMAGPILHHDIHVLRPPTNPAQLSAYTQAFRHLRLTSLFESPHVYFETYEEASARSDLEWQSLVRNHHGLIQITVAVPRSQSATIDEVDSSRRQDLILQHGTLLGMLVLAGPLSQDRFPSSSGLRIPPNRPDDEEQRYSVATMYHIPEVRGEQRGNLMSHTFLGYDRFLLENLQSAKDQSHPVARLRCNVRPGPSQKELMSKYIHWGWNIAGERRARENLMADGGIDAVRSAEERGGNDMDEVFVIMERILTEPLLELRIRDSERLLAREARL